VKTIFAIILASLVCPNVQAADTGAVDEKEWTLLVFLNGVNNLDP
jgi:hypothetical protein